MTREEAKKRLEVRLICAKCPEDKMCYDSYLHSICEYTDYCDEVPIEEAVKVAIEVLEQEPCEDAVSRQEVLDCQHFIYDENGEELEVILAENVLNLPPVTPQQKMGHWIETAKEYYKAIHERGCEPDENTPIFLDDIACSECLAKFSVIDNETERFEYCPNCGAKMAESEDKE